MSCRSRGPPFWLLPSVPLCLLAVAPADVAGGVMAVYHAIESFFAGMRVFLEALTAPGR